MLKSAKGILLVLFLYLGLVWTVAFYVNREKLNASTAILTFGLWYTIAGFATLLAILLGTWLYGYFRAYQGRASAHPKPSPAAGPKAPAAGQEDEEALKLLLSEASARLIASPAFSKSDLGPDLVLSGMPLFLVVGAESVGKTSIIANSGFDIELLAGQPRLEKTSPSPTGLANVWLASDVLLIEISGRYFAGDNRRWADLLRVLAAKPKIPLWQRLWKGDLPGFNLRGIIHCSDLRFFLSKPGPDQIERQSQMSQERLRTIVKVFGKRIPVFTVFTKADQIPYFRDFFGRFSERDAEQILGCTLPLPESEKESDQAAIATSDSKRISKFFSALYTSLTERRLSVLFYEPNAGKKSRIYEFPREFNRLRQVIVDFLTQTFRASPLEITPLNRGFYFSGTREVEPAPVASDTSGKAFDTVGRSFQQAMDATYVFKGDPGAGPDADLQVSRVRRGGFQTRWAFLGALFKEVIYRDRSVDSFLPSAPESRFGSTRSPALTAVLSASAVLGLFWTISWIQNAGLVQEIYQGASVRKGVVVSPGELPSLPQLRSLDSLRKQVELLSDYERTSSVANLWHLTMRFGLYEVPELQDHVRKAYFRRLKAELLDVTHDKLAEFLQSLGKTGPPGEIGTAKDRLKAYMMTTSSGKCTPEPEVIIAGLAAMLQSAGMPSDDPRFPLAVDQVRFYARELQTRNPIHLIADADVQAHAIQYVNSIRDDAQRYRSLRNSVASEFHDSVPFSPSSKGVLISNSKPVSAAFTPQGWESFYAKLQKTILKPSVDPCLLAAPGDQPDTDIATKYSDEEKLQIQNLYAREYLTAWSDFLSGFHVVTSFNSARDSKEQLEILSGPESPLLELFKFVSENTTFRSRSISGLQAAENGIQAWLLAHHLNNVLDPPKEVQFTLIEVERSFQPVQSVVPADSEKWITKENGPYVDALGKMAQAMADIDRNKNDVQAAKNGLDALGDADKAIRALRKEFKPTPVGSMDDVVVRLLKEPVEIVRRNGHFNTTDKDVKVREYNRKLRMLCDSYTSVVGKKFPFAQSGPDLSAKEFTDLFAPESGTFWEQTSALANLVVRENKVWKQNPAEELRASSDLTKFLKNAQRLSNVFFADGRNLGISYYLRPPMLANTMQEIQFDIEGNVQTWDNSHPLRQQFTWNGKSTAGVIGKTGAHGNLVKFTTQAGVWAVFKMFQEAQRTGNVFTWNNKSDSPVQMEFVLPPPDLVDMFDPTFYRDLQCPGAAVQQ